MKRHNRNFRRSKPTVHNQNKPFNPKKYGPNWDHISMELRHGKPVVPEGANQPIIGTLYCGKIGHIDLTYTEASKVIETLQSMQSTYRKAQRLGMIEDSYGQPKINEKLAIKRM